MTEELEKRIGEGKVRKWKEAELLKMKNHFKISHKNMLTKNSTYGKIIRLSARERDRESLTEVKRISTLTTA